MNLKYTNLDLETCTKEELEKEIAKLEIEMWNNYNIQLALKILLNSSYGVIGNKYFICYNKDIAESITLQGQNIIMFVAKSINRYILKHWYEDDEIHKKLNVKPLKNPTQSVVVAGDTDSCASDTRIITDEYEDTIENIFENHMINGELVEFNDVQQSIIPKKLKVLNYKNNKLEYSNVKYLYRHKVKKPKWKIKTKSGKEVIVTNDHSMIVFRDDTQIKVKPSEILVTDKILSVSLDLK